MKAILFLFIFLLISCSSSFIYGQNEKKQLNLHASLLDFEENLYFFKTDKFTIRVDVVNGQYRYASWNKGKSTQMSPDLVLFSKNPSVENEINDIAWTDEVWKFTNGSYEYMIISRSFNRLNTTQTHSSGISHTETFFQYGKKGKFSKMLPTKAIDLF